MLQQILQDMWVDPEILAELDESQKQTLFCRMREEQVRRWRVWDQEDRQKPPKPPSIDRGGGKKVQFMLGMNGEPWVWVMGEHPDDKSIDAILEEEAREAARVQAEQEAEQLRLSVEAELTELLEMGNKKEVDAMEGTEDIYCSVDEMKIHQNLPAAPTIPPTQPLVLADRRDALQEISLNKPHKVSQRVAMWERRVMEERTSEIFRRIQKKKMEAVKEAEEAEFKHEQLWREQERRAKEAELQIREIARRAREEHRRSSVLDMDTSPTNSTVLPSPSPSPTSKQSHFDFGGPKPPNKEAIIEWFRSSEVARRAGLEPDRNIVTPWFHGLITRQEAESRLNSQPIGSFLVRVSERIWGYAISYRDVDRCKHYLVDASNGHYQFLGTNQITHNTLGDLVAYHSIEPITVSGGETLGIACRRPSAETLPAIFNGLLVKSR